MVGDFNYINELFNNPRVGVAVNSVHGHLEGVISLPKDLNQEFLAIENYIRSKNVECGLLEFIKSDKGPFYARQFEVDMLNFNILTLNRQALKACDQLDWPNKENYKKANTSKEEFAVSNIRYAISKGKIKLSYFNEYTPKYQENIKQLRLRPTCDLDMHLYLRKFDLDFNIDENKIGDNNSGKVVIKNDDKNRTIFYLDEDAIKTLLSHVISIEELPEFKNKDQLKEYFKDKISLPYESRKFADKVLEEIFNKKPFPGRGAAG